MSILDRIVADTRELVARTRRRVPQSALAEMPLYARPTLGLEATLRREELSILAEIKRASPSRGVIREDFDVEEIARQYGAGGASALSVLTEPLHFKGSLDYLAAVRRVVDLPLLRKDFIIDEYQIHEAKAYGADAVLLIATVLEASELSDLHQAAAKLGLACLVEVYSAEEFDRIDFDQVHILGVNNRNLHTFQVDLDHSLQLFGSVPSNLVKVSESGIRSGADLARLRLGGVDAALIGESFMAAPNPGERLSIVLGEMRAHLQTSTESLRIAG